MRILSSLLLAALLFTLVSGCAGGSVSDTSRLTDGQGGGNQPAAKFSYAPYYDDVVSFDASRSTGNIILYSWDFGNGLYFSSAFPFAQSSYADGVYTVTLTVTEDDGDTDTVSKEITIPIAVHGGGGNGGGNSGPPWGHGGTW